MRRFAVPAMVAAVAIVLLIVLAVGISSQGANNSLAYGVQSGKYKTAPDRTTQLPVLSAASTGASARTESLSNYRGKLVLVNLFASWCVPCQQEAPVLGQAEKLLSAHGGTVLGVTYQDSPQNELGFIRRYSITYPVLNDVGGGLAKAFGITNNGVPDTYLVSPSGKIVWLDLFQLGPNFVKQTLPQLIAKFA
jgi:cytochrome c biogenesis protein CcmG/thiol:disulfide interchange protein DsbE